MEKNRYNTAYSRNLGWVTNAEQDYLRNKRIAVAGLGGVGGSHLLTLTRLGIGAFNISDLDTFETVNLNRQAGASASTLGRPKVDVLAEMATDINPDLNVRRFPGGINAGNVDEFLEGCDLYVDGIDFFAMDARRLLFDACARKAIPAITAAPLGMGAALLTFMPGCMTFEQYFKLEGHSHEEQQIRLMAGLSPRLLQASYLADPSVVDFVNRKVPSTSMACELCAGIAATEALKILLKRGRIRPAPHGLHFDAYRQKLVRTWRPWGNANPVQKFLIAAIRKTLAKRVADHPAAPNVSRVTG